jgi:hypothetical protein
MSTWEDLPVPFALHPQPPPPSSQSGTSSQAAWPHGLPPQPVPSGRLVCWHPD